jgi:regulator of RNase E activity RraA
MSEDILSEAEFAALVALDTPTVCNALEIVAPHRRAVGFTTKQLVCPRPGLPPIVGYARTARMRAMTPALPEAVDRVAYYEYVAAGADGAQSKTPRIIVIEDLDSSPGFGAFWGEVNTNIHKAIGCLGLITNGSIRDLDDCAEGFQMLAGNVGPSHAHVHITDFGGDIIVHGMAVSSGDLIHADQHGAVIIPHDVARAVPEAAAQIAAREAIVLDACKAPGSGIAEVKAALSKAAEYH